MEPVTTATVTTAWTIAKNAGELGKKLYTVAKKLKDGEAQQEVHEIVDSLHDLKGQYLLVLIQNVFRHKPDKIALLGPFVQHIGASVFAPDIWLSETRNARHEHVSVNDAARLLLLSFPRQR
jgi:hypothetical protein